MVCKTNHFISLHENYEFDKKASRTRLVSNLTDCFGRSSLAMTESTSFEFRVIIYNVYKFLLKPPYPPTQKLFANRSRHYHTFLIEILKFHDFYKHWHYWEQVQ